MLQASDKIIYMIRIFTAIELPEDIKDSLTSLKTKIKGAKWVDRAQMHLTLSFIGEVSEHVLKEIKNELESLELNSFKIKLKGLGFWQSNGIPKVIWVGVDPNDNLNLLKEKIDQHLKNIGVLIDKKKYIPHITLARVRGGNLKDLAQMAEGHSLFETREFSVNEFILFSSKLTSKGAIHSNESVFPLEVP